MDAPVLETANADTAHLQGETKRPSDVQSELPRYGEHRSRAANLSGYPTPAGERLVTAGRISESDSL